MNWKQEAIEKLKKLEAMQLSIENIPQEIKRLEIAACGLRGAATDRTPVKGGGSRREDALLTNIVHRQELKYNREQAAHWVKATQNALSALTMEENLILTRMYIRPERGALERLSGELELEQSSLYRHRDRALRKFTMALYGVDEGQVS